MTEAKKDIKKNPNPLVIKGIFFVTADYDDKQYVVSNGISFIRFKKEGENIVKGDYVEVHGPVYQRRDAANAIITGEAIVRKLDDKEVEAYKAAVSSAVKAATKDKPKTDKKKAAPKSDKKMPWE